MTDAIDQALAALLADKPEQTARELARALRVAGHTATRKDVNRVLYGDKERFLRVVIDEEKGTVAWRISGPDVPSNS